MAQNPELDNVVYEMVNFIRKDGPYMVERYGRGPRSRWDFTVTEDRALLRYALDRRFHGKLTTTTFHRAILRDESFRREDGTTTRALREIRARLGALVRECHRIELWRAFAGDDLAIEIDQDSPYYLSFLECETYLHYYLLPFEAERRPLAPILGRNHLGHDEGNRPIMNRAGAAPGHRRNVQGQDLEQDVPNNNDDDEEPVANPLAGGAARRVRGALLRRGPLRGLPGHGDDDDEEGFDPQNFFKQDTL